MKRLFLPLLGFLSLVLICCNDNKESGNDSYDPNKPVTIDYFTPDTGRVAEKVIIIGNNFGNDKSAVTVLFTDNMEKENKAAVVGVDNTTIYCMAPRQAEGFNKITVKVMRLLSILFLRMYLLLPVILYKLMVPVKMEVWLRQLLGRCLV